MSRPNHQAQPSADTHQGLLSGVLLGAHEAGLRDCWRQVHAARLAGCVPLGPTTAEGRAAAPLPTGPMGAGMLSGGGQTPAVLVNRGIAVVDVVGPLSKGEDLYNWFFGTLTYGQLVEQVDQARRDVRVQALMLRIDSPGGTVAGVSDLCEAILAFRAAKPVVAAVSDLAASCGYQVACCANRIFADRDALIGCIGTLLVIDDVSRMYQDAGWTVRVFATERDPYKGEGMPGAPLTAEQADDFQRLVDQLGGEFIRSIYETRPAMRTGGMKLPDGRVYLAEDAVAKKLIDGVASWPKVLAAMQEGDLDGAALAGGK